MPRPSTKLRSLAGVCRWSNVPSDLLPVMFDPRVISRCCCKFPRGIGSSSCASLPLRMNQLRCRWPRNNRCCSFDVGQQTVHHLRPAVRCRKLFISSCLLSGGLYYCLFVAQLVKINSFSLPLRFRLPGQRKAADGFPQTTLSPLYFSLIGHAILLNRNVAACRNGQVRRARKSSPDS